MILCTRAFAVLSHAVLHRKTSWTAFTGRGNYLLWCVVWLGEQYHSQACLVSLGGSEIWPLESGHTGSIISSATLLDCAGLQCCAT